MDAELASLVAFRPPIPVDVPFILDSWVKTWRESPWAGCVRNDRIYEETKATVEGLLARGARLEIACARNDQDKILGYSCFEAVNGGLACHWVYVKDPYRKRGLATALVARANGQAEAAGVGDARFYTHRTRGSQWIPGGDWRHEPIIARRK